MEEGFKMAQKRWYDYGTYYEQASYNEPDWCNRFFGEANCRRLKRIKRRVDPNNVFSCHQCIGDEETPYVESPTMEPATEYTGDVYETSLCQQGYAMPPDQNAMGFNPLSMEMMNCHEYNAACYSEMCFPPWLDYKFRMTMTKATGCCVWTGEQWQIGSQCSSYSTCGSCMADDMCMHNSNTNTCHYAETADMASTGWVVMPESCPGSQCSSYSSCDSCMADDVCMYNSNTNTCHFAEEADMAQTGWVVMPEMCPECWQKSNAGVDLKRGEWDGSGGTDFEQCKQNAKNAGVQYFAWTGEVYQPGYCKVQKPTVTRPNLNTNQGYGYQLWEDTCGEAPEECWKESSDGVDLKRGEWDGSGGTDFHQCKENAKNAGVQYFAWTGEVYQPGYCKVLKRDVRRPNLNTNQGYGYKLWENTCSSRENEVG